MIRASHVVIVALVLALAILLLATRSAGAQSAGAEALFREGRALIKRGDLKAGCEKLAASEKLESSVGTLLNLGDCNEKLGRSATAWAAFRKAEDMAKRAGDDKKRQREAKRRADALESKLATLTIQVGPNGKRDGLIIKRDGEVLDTAVWGTAIVVDPGSHVIVAEAPGAKPWRTEISVGRGGKRWVVVPTLQKVAVTPAPSEPPPAVVVETPPPPPVAEPAPQPVPPRTATVVTRTWSPARQIAVGVAVVGAGVVGGGIYFGTRSKDQEDRANALCPETLCDNAEALRLNDDAQTNATRANAMFIVGGAALAAAGVAWIVGKPDEETMVVPVVGGGEVGASLARRF